MSTAWLLGVATGFPAGIAVFALLDLWFDRDDTHDGRR